jgi:hypothetical protein
MTSCARTLRIAFAVAISIALAACAVDTSPGTPDPATRAGDVMLRSTQLRNGGIFAEVERPNGEVLFSLSFDPMTRRLTAHSPNQDPVSFESPSDEVTRSGAELAAFYLYRHESGLRDEPGCDPPANFMTTLCLSHMCAVHDQCYFDNPDKATHPCVGSVTNFWISVKNWALGSADYCDMCNLNAIGATLKDGADGCELSGECAAWDCGCDAKQCTVDGATVCLASGDCHQLQNSE